jgi:hypothetical protein
MMTMRIPPKAASALARPSAGVSRSPVMRREEVDGFEVKSGRKSPPPVTLQRGSTGAAVKALQDRLVKGRFMAQADVSTGPGVYGPRTEQAVKRFQESVGLQATGVAGPATLQALNTSSARFAPAVKPPVSAPELGEPSARPTKTFGDDPSSTHRMLAAVPSRTLTEETTDTTMALEIPER